MFKQYKNILLNIIKNRDFTTLVEKIKNKFDSDTSVEAKDWAKKNKTNLENFCKTKDKKLWEDCLVEFNKIEKEILIRLKKIPKKYHCPANLPLLYFLIRYFKPNQIIETGVAAGTSSETILHAIKKNGGGFLYSSDLPYYKVKNAEKFIGSVVSDDLKKFWKLDIRGDSLALDNFISLCEKIDFFHYDSNKSYSGRDFAIKKVNKYFMPNSILLMDDIQDNIFFKNFVKEYKLEFKVFKFKDQYVGLIEKIGLQLKDK
jgi:predicted O-methyltransferase YrrM|tara:strand:- start:2082 stop:2858 length:777 start_codon:yes stop_codon:yes gene_type:complete